MRRTRAALAAATAMTLGAAIGATSAGAAGLDQTFGVGGFSLTPLSQVAGDRYQATAAAPGGGTYNAGYTTLAGSNQAFVLTRTDAAGRLDPTFGVGGVTIVDVAPAPFVDGPVPPAGGAPQAGPSGSGETAKGVAVQPDGKVVVVGQAETVQDGSKPDSRDLDVYVARFGANGVLDPTFGVGGVARVDLSDGVAQYAPGATTTTVTADQAAYGVHVRPNGKIVFAASQGLDGADPSRTDREIVAVQLDADGTPDAAFGVDGVSVSSNPTINENLRMTLLDPEGKLVVSTYSNIGGLNRPFIYRFNADGTRDTTFAGGIASHLVAGPAPGMAEAYGVAMHQGKYLFTGYGIRSTTPENSVDLVAYRFNQDGSWDQSFGTDGLVTYNRADGAGGNLQDRSRNHVVLPDGRFVTAGQSGPDALMVVFNVDGTPDTSVSPDGGIVLGFGGNADAAWGIAAVGDGYHVVGAGWRATSGAPAADDAALAKLDLSPAIVPPPAPPQVDPPVVETPAPPVAPIAKAPTTTKRPTVRKSRSAGKVTISCKRVGTRTGKRVRCAITQKQYGNGRVRLSIKQKDVKRAKAISGDVKVGRRGASVVVLKTGRTGTFAATIKLPTPAGTVQTVKRTVRVK